ncbi:MAG: GNAT family N-acetyltransferase [Deltaproteobacteria bacterium]|nr:GNAT family N-acetyltransferase [Deltaproteobacteria bacterium]
MGLELRVLGPGDEAEVQQFLLQHPFTTMFLRSNLRAAGLVDRGQIYGATWMAATVAGDIVGVAALCWNGVILVQSGDYTAELVRAVARSHSRKVLGLIGPWSMVTEGLNTLGLNPSQLQIESREDLFVLDLAELRVPVLLQSGEASCLPAQAEHFGLLSEWSADFGIETMGESDTPEYRRRCREGVVRSGTEGHLWELLVNEQPVSTSNFNACLPDCVQIGGVWTPEAERGKGYARSVVAGSLLAARSQGVRSSVLFTPETNEAARRAYESLGYRKAGDYGILLFREGHSC